MLSVATALLMLSQAEQNAGTPIVVVLERHIKIGSIYFYQLLKRLFAVLKELPLSNTVQKPTNNDGVYIILLTIPI